MSKGRAAQDADKDRVLSRLAVTWKENPELRLGQLLSNALNGKTLADRDRDLFYTEDYVLIERIEQVYGHC